MAIHYLDVVRQTIVTYRVHADSFEAAACIVEAEYPIDDQGHVVKHGPERIWIEEVNNPSKRKVLPCS